MFDVQTVTQQLILNWDEQKDSEKQNNNKMNIH